MATAGEIVRQFYDAVVARDLATARTFVADDVVVVGLFETYRSAGDFIAAFTRLLQITISLQVKTIIAQADEAAIFFEVETMAPVEATVLVAEWHQIRNGKIAHVTSAFDGRPFAALFPGGQS